MYAFVTKLCYDAILKLIGSCLKFEFSPSF